jgi:uncharacterized protein YbjT (DUF2867 family)
MFMITRILVTGGTGTLGRALVPRLRSAGADVRTLSRHPGDAATGDHAVADLSTGTGLAAAVAGIDVIVHLAGSAKGDGDKARNLVEAVRAAGTRPHLVFISVVGADRVPVRSAADRAMFGYFAAKREAELAVEESGLPWTTLRATQFHDLALMTVQTMAKLPLVPIPSGVSFQPVDTDEVAARMAELAVGEPAGLVRDLAGPTVYPMAELVRSYLRAAGKKRLLVPVPAIGGAARAIKAGANLAPDAATGKRTWEEFLSAHVSR